MARRKISVEEFTNDVLAGLSDSELMKKYRVSRRNLDAMMVKLMERGELKPADLADASQKPGEATLDLALTCPECGALNLFGSDQCHECGHSRATMHFKALDSQEAAPLSSQDTPHVSTTEPADEVVLEDRSTPDGLEREDDLIDLNFLDSLGEEKLPEQVEPIAEPDEPIPEPPPPPPRKKNVFLYIAAAALFLLTGVIGIGLYTEVISLPFGSLTQAPMAVEKPPTQPATPGPPQQRIAATKPSQSNQPPTPVPSLLPKAAPVPVQDKLQAPVATHQADPAKDASRIAKEFREARVAKPVIPEPSVKEPEKPPAHEEPVEIRLEPVVEPEPAPRTLQESAPAPVDKPAVDEEPEKPVQEKRPEVAPAPVVPKLDSSPKSEEPTRQVEQLQPVPETKPQVARLMEPSLLKEPVAAGKSEPASRPQQQPSAPRGARDREALSPSTKMDVGPLLKEAILNHDPDTLKVLLDSGVDPNSSDAEGATALMYAARSRCLACVVALLEHGADVRRMDKNGQTALDLARRAGRTRAAEVILARDPEKGPAALLIASREGLADIVQVLAENGVDVNATDKDGNTALIAASENGNLAVVSTLLKKGADVRARNHQGQTALSVLSQAGSSSGRVPSRVRRELVRLLGQQATSDGESLLPKP